MTATPDTGRQALHGSPVPALPRPRRPIDPVDLVEDVEWMVRSGEVLVNAARRLGITQASLVRRLDRLGRGDLVRGLGPAYGVKARQRASAGAR